MLSAREHDVKLWSRREDVAETINREHRNPRYLSDFELPHRIEATTELGEALAGRELVIIAVPSQSLREVVKLASPHLEPGAIIVSAVKGIEYETGLTMHGVLEDVLDADHHPRLVALSGPSFAREIANRQPTVVTLACREEAYAISVQATLSSPWFRCYTQHDVMGVEIAGALKNVIAIAVGMSDGMRAGHNARAALMTRGLAEITRLGVALGAEPETFLGLAGMGDLLLTCTRRPLAKSPGRPGARRGTGPGRDRGRARRGRRGHPHDPSRLPAGPASGRRAADRRAGPGRDRGGEDPRGGRPDSDDPAAEERAGPDPEKRTCSQIREARSVIGKSLSNRYVRLFRNRNSISILRRTTPLQRRAMPPSATLDQIPKGQRVRVVKTIGDDDPISRRLHDLGIRQGVEVEVIRRAPLGDPTVFELCGYQLCLRRSESSRIEVDGAASAG